MATNIIEQKRVVVSIVIPCYNSGVYLPDALESVLSFPELSICEVIVVDDGSTDPETLQVLSDAKAQGCKVFYQPNKGPAAARNIGITNAVGRYILLLDSDNKIRHEYITEGIIVLDKYPEIGVVYGKPAFFGITTSPRFTTHAFDPYKILLGNNVDMCAMIRRSMWAELGGLDEERLLIGHEDWEFWIRVAGAGWGFFFINKTLFDYRIRSNSLITEASQSASYNRLIEYVHKKHYLQYLKAYNSVYQEYTAYQFDKTNPLRSFFKFIYLKYFKKRS